MGSIADNGDGGHYAYRASKAALGGPDAPTPVQESAQGLWRVAVGLKPRDSGRFHDYQGQEIPW